MAMTFEKFRADRSGNIAILFALTAVPLFAAAGLALDYTFVARERTDLQNAIDAAAISLAKMPTNTSQAVLQEKADAFVAAHMPNAISKNIKTTVTASKGQIVINASGDYPTLLVRVLDIVTGDTSHSQMTYKTSTQSSWGNGKVEVVLVLDNTGSMDEGSPKKKIDLLKEAAKALVDTLAAQAVEADTVKIALVPFSSTVRLPTKYQTASWMDTNGQSSIAKEIFNGTTGVKRFNLFSQLKTSWAGCVESRPAPYDVEDPVPTTTNALIVPFFAPDEPDDTYETGSGKNKKTNPSYDNSYLTDGVASTKTLYEKQGAVPKYNTTAIKTIGSNYGPNVGCGLREVVPLTTDLTDKGPIRTGIANMQSTGYTNIPMGLAWGWYALSPNNMLTTNKPYSDTETAKVIVLLSDGKNQFEGAWSSEDKNGSAYSGVGYVWQNRLGTTSLGSMPGKANDRLKTLCTNINAVKKSGDGKRAIDMYTVLVEESDGATNTLMKNCASQADMFYNVQDSADLVTVFNNIAGSIGKLHLSR